MNKNTNEASREDVNREDLKNKKSTLFWNISGQRKQKNIMVNKL